MCTLHLVITLNVQIWRVVYDTKSERDLRRGGYNVPPLLGNSWRVDEAKYTHYFDKLSLVVMKPSLQN